MNEMQQDKHVRVISTRVSPALAAQIEREAAKELLPVATFVRRLLHLHVNGGIDRAAA